jgi:hypothetical protein
MRKMYMRFAQMHDPKEGQDTETVSDTSTDVNEAGEEVEEEQKEEE